MVEQLQASVSNVHQGGRHARPCWSGKHGTRAEPEETRAFAAAASLATRHSRQSPGGSWRWVESESGSEARELEMIQLFTNERICFTNKKTIRIRKLSHQQEGKGIEAGQGECQIYASRWCIEYGQWVWTWHMFHIRSPHFHVSTKKKWKWIPSGR